jgi:hypothetical protein
VAADVAVMFHTTHDDLYKDDRPRHIDRYIDFFGDGWPREDNVDRCEDAVLQSLA